MLGWFVHQLIPLWKQDKETEEKNIETETLLAARAAE